jgi:hypothetical protein
MNRIVVVFGRGFFSDRYYDFLKPRDSKPTSVPTNEQIATAIAAYQEAIAATDKRFADVERRGGGERSHNVSLLDHPWKTDDRIWFEQNPTRTHRMRMAFPGEVDEEVARTPAGHAPITLVRQVEPGSRLRTGVYLSVDLLPVPDSEAVAHALFEVAAGREAIPSSGGALLVLAEKYTARGGAS